MWTRLTSSRPRTWTLWPRPGCTASPGPPQAGGSDADLATFCRVIEILAGGCLATTFVWLQHHGAVRALAALATSGCGGLARAAVRGPPAGRDRARRRPAGAAAAAGQPVPGGYLLDGTAPWVTGWDMVDVVYTLARDESGQLVAALLPAQRSAERCR